MKKYVFSMMTLLTLGTTVCFGETNKEAEQIVTQQLEMVEADSKHEQPTDCENKEQVRKERGNQRSSGMTVKKKEVTYSVQTLHL